jgi:hypothetical protein
LIAAIFALFSTRWAQYLIGAVAVVGLLWYGVHSYNVWVSTQLIEAALAKERATTTPVIEELTQRVTKADKTITDYKAASDKLKAKIELNQGVLNATLKKLDRSTNELAVLRGSDTDFRRLLDAATANTGSTSNASAVARLGQLTSAHYQCQAGFRDERTSHAKTIAGLEQAVAVIEALKQ